MKKSNLSEKMNRLGDDLDIDLAWTEFEKEKKKKRRVIFWLTGLMALALIAIWFAPQMMTDETVAESKISTVSSKKEPEELTISSSLESDDFYNLSKSKMGSEGAVNKLQVKVSDHITTKSQIVSDSKNTATYLDAKINFASYSFNNLEMQQLKEEGLVGQKADALKRDQYRQENQKVDVKEQEQEQNLQKTTYSLDRQTPIIPKLKSHNNHGVSPQVSVLAFSKFDIGLNLPEVSFEPSLINNQNIYNRLWRVNAFLDAGKVLRALSYDDMAYQDRRTKSEIPQEQLRLGVTISRSISRHFYVSTGLSIGRFRTRMEDRFTTFTSTIVEDAVLEIIKTNNIIEEVRGPIAGTLVERNVAIRYQQYIDFSIPITIGYEVPIDNGFGIDFSLSALWSVKSINKGDVHKSFFSVGDYNDINELGYKNNGVLQLGSNLLLTKYLSDKTQLLFGMQYNFDLQNRLSEIESQSDRFRGYGLRLGIRNTL